MAFCIISCCSFDCFFFSERELFILGTNLTLLALRCTGNCWETLILRNLFDIIRSHAFADNFLRLELNCIKNMSEKLQQIYQ